MNKNNSILAALFGILSSGTRRKPEYIRQQALVSLLYPYFFKEAFNSHNGLYAVNLVYIKPPVLFDSHEKAVNDNGIFSVLMRSTRVEHPVIEGMPQVNGIFSITLKLSRVEENALEKTNLQNGIFALRLNAAGVYYQPTENNNLVNGLFEVTLR
jgi:hypothetical protein